MLSGRQSYYEEMTRTSSIIEAGKSNKAWTGGNTVISTVHENVSAMKNMQKMRGGTTPRRPIARMGVVLIMARTIKRREEYVIASRVSKVGRILHSI